MDRHGSSIWKISVACLAWVVVLFLTGEPVNAGLRGPTGVKPMKTNPLGDKVIATENNAREVINEYLKIANSPSPPKDIKEWGTTPEKSIENMLSRFKKAKGDGKSLTVLRRTETISDEPIRNRGDKAPSPGWVNTPRADGGDVGLGKSKDEPVKIRSSYKDDAEARSARRGDAALGRPGPSLDAEWEKRYTEDVPELQNELIEGTKERNRMSAEENKKAGDLEAGVEAEGGSDKDKLLAEAGSSGSSEDPASVGTPKGKPGASKPGAPKKTKPGAPASSGGKPKGGSPSSSGSKRSLSPAQVAAIRMRDKN